MYKIKELKVIELECNQCGLGDNFVGINDGELRSMAFSDGWLLAITNNYTVCHKCKVDTDLRLGQTGKIQVEVNGKWLDFRE